MKFLHGKSICISLFIENRAMISTATAFCKVRGPNRCVQIVQSRHLVVPFDLRKENFLLHSFRKCGKLQFDVTLINPFMEYDQRHEFQNFREHYFLKCAFKGVLRKYAWFSFRREWVKKFSLRISSSLVLLSVQRSQSTLCQIK